MIRTADELGKVIWQEHGVRLQFHPHATATWRPSSRPSGSWTVHIQQMDPATVENADREGLAFGQAVTMGPAVSRPGGEPDIESVTAALRELGTDLFVVVEQDMYPADFDRPKPIAQWTSRYLRGVGIGGAAGPGAAGAGGERS